MCTEIVSDIQNNFCTQHVLLMFCKKKSFSQRFTCTEMFDRLKTENESRKHEIHGLKDILVRENDNRIQETEELRMAMELGKDFHRKIWES